MIIVLDCFFYYDIENTHFLFLLMFRLIPILVCFCCIEFVEVGKLFSLRSSTSVLLALIELECAVEGKWEICLPWGLMQWCTSWLRHILWVFKKRKKDLHLLIFHQMVINYHFCACTIVIWNMWRLCVWGVWRNRKRS